MKAVQVKSGMTSELKFQVDIEGTASPVREVRLSIITELMKISYMGSYKNDVAVFSIRDLENFIGSNKECNFDLEVYVGNNYFAPFTGKIEVINAVSVSASMVGSTVTPKVAAKAVQVEQIKDTFLERLDFKKLTNEILESLSGKKPERQLATVGNLKTVGDAIINDLFGGLKS